MADDSGRLNQVFAETSFLYGANAVFIEMMQEKWATDPTSVPPEWRDRHGPLPLTGAQHNRPDRGDARRKLSAP